MEDDDYLLVYDSSESGSEKTKKRPISDYVATVNESTRIYVDSAGSDSTGDGTSGNPFATPNKGFDWAKDKFVGQAGFVIVDLADGIYNNLDSINIRSVFGPRIYFEGNSSTPSNVVLNFTSNGFSISYGAFFRAKGLKIVGNDSDGGVRIYYNSTATLENVIIEDFQYGTECYSAGHFHFSGGTINSCAYGLYAHYVSTVYIYSTTISNNTSVGISAHSASEVVTNNMTYSGNTLNTNTSTNGRITAI